MSKSKSRSYTLGIMFRREYSPVKVVQFTKLSEEIGLNQVWFVEDFAYSGGISQVTAALASTSKISIGIGIMPIVVRNVAFTAMEIATICNLFPGRFIAGFGHGVSSWMKQIGALPKSQIIAMEEAIICISRLLKGENVTFLGSYVQLNNAFLNYKPEMIPPIYLGVSGPKSIKISALYSDGTLLSEHTTIQKIQLIKAQINREKKNKVDSKKHKIALYIWCSVNEDEEKAYDQIRPTIAISIKNGYMNEVFKELQLAEVTITNLQNKRNWTSLIPKEWIDPIAIVGNPKQCIEKINLFTKSGIDNLILVPLFDQDPIEVLESYKEMFKGLFY